MISTASALTEQPIAAGARAGVTARARVRHTSVSRAGPRAGATNQFLDLKTVSFLSLNCLQSNKVVHT
jgi:hypothetical protein